MTEWVISLFCLLWLTPNSTSAGGLVKNLQCKRRRFSPWVRRSPGGGHGKTVQYSCLENSMGRGAWRARVRGHTRTQSRLKWLSTARTHGHTMGQKGLCTSYQDPQKVSTHTHFWKWANRNSVVAVRLTGQACPNFTQPGGYKTECIPTPPVRKSPPESSLSEGRAGHDTEARWMMSLDDGRGRNGPRWDALPRATLKWLGFGSRGLPCWLKQ